MSTLKKKKKKKDYKQDCVMISKISLIFTWRQTRNFFLVKLDVHTGYVKKKSWKFYSKILAAIFCQQITVKKLIKSKHLKTFIFGELLQRLWMCKE